MNVNEMWCRATLFLIGRIFCRTASTVSSIAAGQWVRRLDNVWPHATSSENRRSKVGKTLIFVNSNHIFAISKHLSSTIDCFYYQTLRFRPGFVHRGNHKAVLKSRQVPSPVQLFSLKFQHLAFYFCFFLSIHHALFFSFSGLSFVELTRSPGLTSGSCLVPSLCSRL